MTRRRNLPIGKSSFERIRADNDLYVDKTEHIHHMVDTGAYYFLARPRRFGKSLTVSTLKCLFEGRKELFDGLWISRHGDWSWQPHPVISFDFNGITHDTPENFKSGLAGSLHQAAGTFGVTLHQSFLKELFRELILSVHRQTGALVVILIDEYDKPLIDHLGKGKDALEIAKANRDILKNFLGVIKDGAVAAVLRFVFITGVSKFSQVSIFSELNNLSDITMHRDYAEILGYTQEELEGCFAACIDPFARGSGTTPENLLETLKRHYNGYRFSERDVRVYNPFSILRAMDEKTIKNYWFETGTPTFLVDLIRENNWYPPEIEALQATEVMFSTYEIEALKPEALLFQTGYITIKDVDNRLFTFDYPNQEVKTAFLETLFHAYSTGIPNQTRFLLLTKHLINMDLDAFFETVRAIFADIPYPLESKRDEAYFHTLFYLMVSASGADAASEVLTCDGRIDMVVRFPEKVFIMEFKCNQSAEAALRQIHDRHYADRFRQSGKEILLLGINFDTETRNVADWRWERA